MNWEGRFLYTKIHAACDQTDGVKYYQLYRAFSRKLSLLAPLPVAYFGKILTVLADVLLVSYQRIHHLLIEVRALVAQLGQSLYHVENEVESVDLVLYSHVERSGDSSLFVVAANKEVAVLAVIQQLVYQRWIAVEREDYRLVLGEQRVEISVAQTVRVSALRLKLKEVYYVYKSDLYLRQVLAHDGNSRQTLQSRSIAAAGEYNVRLFALVVGSPLPYAYTLCAVLYSLLHSQPLGTGVLRSYHYVYIVLRTYAVVEAGEQAVSIRRQIHSYNVCLLVGNVVEEAGVLMSKAVVVLLPYVRGKYVVERSDLLTPRQLRSYFQPLSVLREHRVYYSDECFVACKEAVAACEQVALEPAFAHMLGKHRVHNSSVVSEEFVAVVSFGVPVAVGFLKNLAQSVGHIKMKTEIYTIPIQDAFAEESECPVCRMYQKLEENAINYTIGPGASYMEGDIREQSDEQGFCQKHLEMLYEYPNKLGLAMMLKTHMDKTAKELKKAMKAPLPQAAVLFRKKSQTVHPVITFVEEKEKKCFVCDYINHSFTNYINTIYYLYEKEEDFRKQFAASKGFCVNHYKVLFSGAPEYMGKKYLNEFLMTLNETFINGYERVRDDLEWFICKNDYRYKEQPWKNARDALQRGLVKAGSIMEAEEKKE